MWYYYDGVQKDMTYQRKLVTLCLVLRPTCIILYHIILYYIIYEFLDSLASLFCFHLDQC